MRCPCKPSCQGPCAVEILKTAMFSQPKRPEGPPKQLSSSNVDAFTTIQHLEMLFKEHRASDILRSGFNDALVCIPPLLLVSSVGYNEGVIKLVAAGANVNLQNPKDGNTPLILATKGKHVETMNILLTHSANVSISNQEGNNAFMIAVTTGSPAPVNLLWQHRRSFNIDFRNKLGYSALLLAAERCWESCINMLITIGANKNLLTEHSDSALAISTKANDRKSVNRLLNNNIRITTENKSCEMPLCIAVTQHKSEIFELIAKRMDSTERQYYVAKKLELLKRKSFPGYNTDVDYYIACLFPVLHKILWHDLFKGIVQQKNFAVALISMFCRHMNNDELVQRSAELLTLSMHDGKRVEETVITDFITKQCPEIMLKSLQFYTSTAKHKQSATILSLMLPIFFSCTQDKGLEWLRDNWYAVISFIHMYEKTYLHMHYDENRPMVDRVWRSFKKKFELIQQEKADLACAELLHTEALEKAKVEKKEKKKSKKQKKRASEAEETVVESTPHQQDLLVEKDSKEEVPHTKPIQTRVSSSGNSLVVVGPCLAVTVDDGCVTDAATCGGIVVTAVDDLADIADDEDEADDDMKLAKHKKKRRKRKKGKGDKYELGVPVNMLNEDEVRVAFSYEMTGGAAAAPFVADLSGKEEDNFETVMSKKSLKQRKRLISDPQRLANGAESLDDTDSNKSNQSSKSVSPSPVRAVRGPDVLPDVCATSAAVSNATADFPIPSGNNRTTTNDQTLEITEVLPQPLATNDYLVPPPANFDNTEPPIAQMAAIVLEEPESSPPSDSPNDRSQRLKTASNFLQELDPQPAVSEEPPYHTDQAQVTVTEGAPVDSCLGFSIPSLHTTTGAQQLPPCSHFSQAPSVSWADLLKHKDAEFPKLGAKVTCNPTAFTWAYNTKNSSLVQPLCLQQSAPDSTESSYSSRKDKEGFTLSEFILPEVARKINSAQGEGLVYNASASDPQSTDSDIGLLSQNDLLGESVAEGISAVGGNQDSSVQSQQASCSLNHGRSNQAVIMEDTAPDLSNLTKSGTKASGDNTTSTQQHTFSPTDRDYLMHFMDEEFPIGKVPLLDPRYTNFLTDIRVPDIKPSPLDDIGFLSNSSDDDVDTQQTVAGNQQIPGMKPPAPTRLAPKTIMQNPATNQNIINQNKYEPQTAAMTAEPPGQRNMDIMTTLYQYHNAVLMQQRANNMPPAGAPNNHTAAAMTNFWMPYNQLMYRNQQQTIAYNHQTMFGNPNHQSTAAATGYRPGTLRPQQPANYFQQQPNPISSTAGKIYTQPPKPQISQQYQIPPKHDIPSPTTAVNNMALIWQDSMPAKRHDLLTWQFQAMPKDKLVIKGNIVLCVENKFILGKSTTYSCDVLVLLGMVGKVPAAVKRLPMALFAPLKDSLYKLLQPKFHYEYLVRYLDIAEDDNYGYIAQELCDFTLDEYIHLLIKKKGLNPAVDVSVLFRLLYQMFRGLQMLHFRCSMLHRNMKPSNILIDAAGKLKLSDYGLTHVTSEGMTVFYSNKIGDNCWRPRECVSNTQQWMAGSISMAHYTMHSDIQVAGMLAHYILTAGQHPYGDNAFDIEVNIAGGWLKMKEINNEANHLLWLMMSKESRDRPDIHNVLRHPYFWSEKRRFEMLVAVGCELVEMAKTYCYKNITTEKLNNISCHVVSRDWCKAVETKLLDEMDVDRSSATTVCDLLMFFFHLHQTYNRLSIHVRSGLGQPHLYFLSRFPHLFISVYKIVRVSDWINKPALKQYLQ